MDVANYTKHIQDWGFPSLFAILLWNLYTKTNRRNERQSFMWYTHRLMTLDGASPQLSGRRPRRRHPVIRQDNAGSQGSADAPRRLCD